MKTMEFQHLLAEQKALEQMIADTPPDRVISRRSLIARLEDIKTRIAAAHVDERAPSTMKLIFRGKPVINNAGIFAEFGTKAIAAFNEIIAALAAATDAPLAETGPIRNRDQNQLLITSTVQGSFGFELQEHCIGQMRLDEITPTQRAIQQAHALLRGMLSTDDDLADAAGEVPPRAMDRTRDFLKTLLDAEAYCTADLGGNIARFNNVDQVKRSLDRIRQDNLVEREIELVGQFLGVLPKSRSFEFELIEDKQVVRGKVDPSILNIEALNGILGQTVTIRVAETKLGKGRARYRILEAPMSDP